MGLKEVNVNLFMLSSLSIDFQLSFWDSVMSCYFPIDIICHLGKSFCQCLWNWCAVNSMNALLRGWCYTLTFPVSWDQSALFQVECPLLVPASVTMCLPGCCLVYKESCCLLVYCTAQGVPSARDCLLCSRATWRSLCLTSVEFAPLIFPTSAHIPCT